MSFRSKQWSLLFGNKQKHVVSRKLTFHRNLTSCFIVAYCYVYKGEFEIRTNEDVKSLYGEGLQESRRAAE